MILVNIDITPNFYSSKLIRKFFGVKFFFSLKNKDLKFLSYLWKKSC